MHKCIKRIRVIAVQLLMTIIIPKRIYFYTGSFLNNHEVNERRKQTLAATHIPATKPPALTEATMASRSGTCMHKHNIFINDRWVHTYAIMMVV